MDKLKALFGDKALTYAELEAALKDSKEIKLANLASGQYVDIGKFKQAETQANDLQAQLAQRNRDLAELKKLDAAGIQAQLDTLKGKYADDTRALTVAYPSIERFCADAGYRGTFTFDASQTLGVVLIFLRKSSLTNGRSFPGAGLWSGRLPGSIIPASLVRTMRY